MVRIAVMIASELETGAVQRHPAPAAILPAPEPVARTMGMSA